MTIRLSVPFVREYRALPIPLRHKVDKLLRLLAVNTSHPSLRVRKMVNHPHIYEARVDLQYRVTFEKQADRLVLRRVGTHAIYKQP